jgi:hypothetical protein
MQRIKELLTADTLQLSKKEIKIKRLKELQRLNVEMDTIPYLFKRYKADSSQSTYNEWYDSIRGKDIYKAYKKDSTQLPYLKWKRKYRVKEIKQKKYNNYTISKWAIINIIANANLTQFTLVLENMFYEDKKYKDRIRLVLAKFGYKDFAEKALNHIKQQVKKDKYKIMDYEEDLYYIGTQEAFAYFGKFLKTDLKKDCTHSEYNNKKRNYGYYVLYKLSYKIKNIPIQRYVTKCRNENTYKINPDDNLALIDINFCKVIPYYPDNILDKMYRWMKENKGNYEIKDYERTL